MNPLGPLHSDNTAVKVMTLIDQSKLYIGLLWASRRNPLARQAIRSHVRNIRRWSGL